MTISREWDASTYDVVSRPQQEWGAVVVERLDLRGDETVLDAGCGTGRVTELLLARLPRGRVIALDASANMLDGLRRRLTDPRIETVEADLGRPLPIREPVDAVLSTATFHWVLDHDALFRHLAAVIRPGGQLVAQCGGAGNTTHVRASVAAVSQRDFPITWFFAGADDTADRLRSFGFVDVRTWLAAAPARFGTAEELETFLAAVVLRTHLEILPPDEHAPFVRAVVAQMGDLVIDYVRLNIVARRG